MLSSSASPSLTSMSYFLCVDCGGSKTAAVITGPDGNTVGRGVGGPSNLTYLTGEAYISAVKAAIAQALTAASLPADLPPTGPTPFATAWFGVSGADSPSVMKTILAPLSTLVGIPVGPDLILANDTHLLAAPIRFYNDVSKAVSIISGTGAIAVSFEEVDGQILECSRAGGWGWILGDEGGGFDVGREAIRQILHVSDQASVRAPGLQPPQSWLRDKILERFGITSVMEVLQCVYLPDPLPGVVVGPDAPPLNLLREKRLSTLPPLVFEAAFEHADPLALDILSKCAEALVETASVIVGVPTEDKPRLVDPQTAVLSFGGSLVGVEKYRQIIVDKLATRGHVFKHITYIEDPAMTGAQSLAAQKMA